MSGKTIFLGVSAVGKTSIAMRMCEKWCNATPTVGVDNYTINYEGRNISLYDTAGQEKYKSLLPLYLRSASVALIVYDVSDINSFYAINEYYEMTQQHQIPKVIIVGNKIDLGSVVTQDEIDQLTKDLNCQHIFTSAMSCENIDTLIKMIADLIDECNDDNEPTTEPTKKEEPSPSCCLIF